MGTASRADAYLLLEVRGQWARDAIETAAVPPPARDAVERWLEQTPRAKLLLVRRPERRRGGLVAFVVRSTAPTPSIRRIDLERLADLVDVKLDRDGVPVETPLALVCGHGRRDPCCASLGPGLFEGLRSALGPESLWLSSHQGGHRFAPNLLWLPHGLAFARVPTEDAPALVRELLAGRLPVTYLRGRATLAPEEQAAEIAARERFELRSLAAPVVLGTTDGVVRLETEAGEVDVAVEAVPGPHLSVSCGADPEPTTRYAAHVVGPR
jgi:hypothetical protein